MAQYTRKEFGNVMIIADFSNTDNIIIYPKSQLYQYDKGQHLNIVGLDIEYFSQIRFITDMSATIVTDAEEITDGFRVTIPDSILSESGHYKDYWITAYITFTNGDNTTITEKVVKIYVNYISETDSEYNNATISDTNITVIDDNNGNITLNF